MEEEWITDEEKVDEEEGGVGGEGVGGEEEEEEVEWKDAMRLLQQRDRQREDVVSHSSSAHACKFVLMEVLACS